MLYPGLLRWTASGLRLEDALIIAGSNRSGTTWLQEVLAELPGSVTSFEPLHVDVIPAARAAGFHKLSWFDPCAEHPLAERYLRNVLSGREWSGYSAQFNTLSNCLRPRQLVVKFIHANGILDWMTGHLPVRRPLVVVRHPAAVNSSVLNKQWNLSDLQQTLLRSELVQGSPELTCYIGHLKTPIEQLTARWCLENAILFKSTSPRKFDLVTYESLVLGGPAALMDLFKNWNLAAPESVATAHARDSFMSASNRSYNSAAQRLSKWRSEITESQLAQILKICRDFGLDFYSEESAPDELLFRNCTASGLLDTQKFAARAA